MSTTTDWPPVAARWTTAAPWSNGSLVFGAGVTLEILAILSVSAVLYRVRTRFYFSLWVTLICACIDLSFNAIYAPYGRDTVRDVFWCLASWWGNCGFCLSNYTRLCRLLEDQHQRAKHFLAFLPAISILLYTLYTVDTLWTYNTGADLPIGLLGNMSFTCDVWSVVDGLVNSTLSAAFASLLHFKGRDGVELCPGYNSMLLHVKIMLSIECIIIVATAAINIAVPTFDPLFLTFYFAEGLRFFVYCRFLSTLNSMLRKNTLTGTEGNRNTRSIQQRTTTLHIPPACKPTLSTQSSSGDTRLLAR
ncbi:hypothetical protein RI367_006961 [Sorochytrium milnesiophthora]